DADGDGMLTSEEVSDESTLAGSFEEYDINGDGNIAENEFQSWYAASGDAASGDDVQSTAQADADGMDSSMDNSSMGDSDGLGQDATAASTEPRTDAVAGTDDSMSGSDSDLTAQADDGMADADMDADA